MVCTRNKRVANYRAAERNDASESACGAMVHSIRHTRRAAQTINEGSGIAGDASRTKFKQPPRGVKVALKPSGDE
jgi:hypothetical protein